MPKQEIPAEWTVLSMLEWGTEYLQQKGVNTPRLSIEWLLAHLLGCKRLDLYLKFDRPLSQDELSSFKPMLLRRGKHEPLQYITGSTDFFGLEIKVNPSVLIPRPETEQLVELILDDHPNSEKKTILDIGTGSGCIPLALKSKCASWDVFAFDLSEDALKTAQTNAKYLKLDVTFFKSDLFFPELPSTLQSADIIVSNPPYIEPKESSEIDIEVRNFEPTMALFHENVSSVYTSIIHLAERLLKNGGMLYLEINQRHDDSIQILFNPKSWEIELVKDYNGHPRMFKCRHIKHI